MLTFICVYRSFIINTLSFYFETILFHFHFLVIKQVSWIKNNTVVESRQADICHTDRPWHTLWVGRLCRNKAAAPITLWTAALRTWEWFSCDGVSTCHYEGEERLQLFWEREPGLTHCLQTSEWVALRKGSLITGAFTEPPNAIFPQRISASILKN